MNKLTSVRDTITAKSGVVARLTTEEFRVKVFMLFGDDFDTLTKAFGVSMPTIYRWWNDASMVHPCALKYMEILERGYLPDLKPFDQWHIRGTFIETPMGSFDAYELEMIISARSQLHKLFDENIRLKRELNDFDGIIKKLKYLVMKD